MTAIIKQVTKLHQGRVFRLVREEIQLETGVTTELDIIRHPGAAAIIPVDEKGRVILIHQYRHAVGGRIWEIPAGTLEAGEDPETCAARELVEETGVRAEKLHRLGEITPLPGYADERIHLYLAAGLSEAEQKLDADEVLSVARIPFSEALEMVARGEIQDAKTISGLFFAERWLREKKTPNLRP